jgi:hypothetical protein
VISLNTSLLSLSDIARFVLFDLKLDFSKGATSCYVGDNADLIAIRDGFSILLKKLANTIGKLGKFCDNFKDLPCLGYTHLQPGFYGLF